MQVYKILKRAIERQTYSKEKLQQMLNVYFLVGQLTEEVSYWNMGNYWI